jgi:hypothetical protein
LRERQKVEKTHRGLLEAGRRLTEANQAHVEAARQILRLCLPSPLKVFPDTQGSRRYEGEGRFREGDLREQVRKIEGRLGSTDRPDGPVPPRMVPPG